MVIAVAVVGLIVAAVIAGASTNDVVAPAPVIESKLGHLSCSSPDRCIAVGSTGSRYSIRSPYSVWSGSGSWAAQPPISPLDNGDSFLDSVSCGSQASCMAVGRQEVPAPYFGAKSGGDRQLVETWNGRVWRVVKSPMPEHTVDAQLSAVDCVASRCMAVGSFSRKGGGDRVLTQLWNGSRWTMYLPPRPRVMQDPTLAGVSCVSASSCTAVGHFSYEIAFSEVLVPLVVRWNGTEWRFESSGKLGQLVDTQLGAIDCPSTERCVAVGSQRHGRSTFTSFAEVRDARTWTVSPTQDPPGSQYVQLVDVACPRVDRCIAVGYAVRGGQLFPLVEWWDGSRWTIGSAPTVSDATDSALSGVTCPTPTSCVATGNFRQDSPAEHGFISTWDGARWTTMPSPDPA